MRSSRRRGVNPWNQHRRSAALTVSAVLCLAPACGLGDRNELEERITSAPARLDGTVVTGTFSAETRIVEVPEGTGPGGAAVPAAAGVSTTTVTLPPGGVPVDRRTVDVTLDLAASKASVRAPGSASPTVVFDDLVLYGHRAGVPADEARPWVRLNLAKADETAGAVRVAGERPAAALLAMPPAVFADLTAGVLTGSIETVGREAVAGTPTTHYRVNIAVDKAFDGRRKQRYPDDRREHVELLLDQLAIDGLVHGGDVWLDESGGLRRLRVAFEQHPLPRIGFHFVVTLEVTGTTPRFDAPEPGPESVLSVRSPARFVAAVGGSSDAAPPAVTVTSPGATSTPLAPTATTTTSVAEP